MTMFLLPNSSYIHSKLTALIGMLALFYSQAYIFVLIVLEADGALDKARKHKKRQLEDTLNLVLKKRKVSVIIFYVPSVLFMSLRIKIIIEKYMVDQIIRLSLKYFLIAEIAYIL